MRLRLGLILVLTGAGLSGCGAGARTAAWEQPMAAARTTTSATDADARSALLERAQAAWSQRTSEVHVREAIAAWKQALQLNGADAATWAALSEAYYFLADAHVSFDERRQTEMAAAFAEGTAAAERGLLVVSPEFAERARQGAHVDEQLALFDERAVDNLYWRAMNLNRWSQAEGSSAVRRHSPDVRASMTRVLELAPSVDSGGVYRYFGEYYGRSRQSAGGDLARAKANFEQAMRVAPQHLAAHVLLAEVYAVPTRSRALFDEHLNFVLMHQQASACECECACADVRAENAAAQRRARKLLDQAQTLFR